MNLDRALERVLKDPEKRVKVFIAYNVGILIVNVVIAVGLGVFFLRFAGII
jgi:hypothetical protein